MMICADTKKVSILARPFERALHETLPTLQ